MGFFSLKKYSLRNNVTLSYTLFIYFVHIFNLNKKLTINIISLSIFLLLALRENVGYDYSSYQILYQDRILPIEPISFLLTKISHFFNDPKYFFMIFAFFTILLIRRVAIMNNSVLFLVIYILLPGFFVESFTIVRQSLALSFVIYGISLYINKNKYFILPLILACLTHYTPLPFVLIFLLFVFLKNPRIQTAVGILIPFFFYFTSEIRDTLTSYFPMLIWYDGSQQHGFSLLALFTFIFLITANKIYSSKRIFFWTILSGLFLTYVHLVLMVYLLEFLIIFYSIFVL